MILKCIDFTRDVWKCLRKCSCSSQHSFGRAFANAHIPPMAPTVNAGKRKDADPASKQNFEGSFPVSAMI